MAVKGCEKLLRAGRKRLASTPLQPFHLGHEKEWLKSQLKRRDRSDDADRRA